MSHKRHEPISDYDSANGSYSCPIDQSGHPTSPPHSSGAPFGALHNPEIHSQKQAGLMGIVAGGGTPTQHPGVASGVSQASAKKSLRGMKVKDLPAKKG